MIHCKKLDSCLYIFNYKKFSIKITTQGDDCKFVDGIDEVIFKSHFDKEKITGREFHVIVLDIDIHCRDYGIDKLKTDINEREKLIFKHEFLNDIGLEDAELDKSYFHGKFPISKRKIETLIPLLDNYPERWIAIKI